MDIKKKILIVAPHPDDETLGCGGTILKYVNQGYDVYWLICTEFYRNGKTKDNIRIRNKEIESVSAKFGFTKRFELNYTAAQLTPADIGPLIKKIADIMHEIKPTIVFLPNGSDIHTDHQIVFKAAFSCTKNFNFPFIKKILVYETISETEFSPASDNAFVPNTYINISSFFEQKLHIMETYESEVMSPPFPRSLISIRALAAYRGSAIGENYAEAFMLLKQIID